MHVAFNDKITWPLITANEVEEMVVSHGDVTGMKKRKVLYLHFDESKVSIAELDPYFADPDNNTSVITIIDESGGVYEHPEYVIPVSFGHEFVADDPNRRLIMRLAKMDPTDKAIREVAGVRKVYTGTPLEIAIEKKVDAMSERCTAIIYTGFDVPLSNGTFKRFTFDDQDQANLNGLATMAMFTGNTTIMWHEDDEDAPCEFYTIDEFKNIVGVLSLHMMFNINYFRDLRRYIRSLDNEDAVKGVWYGTPLPEEFISDTLQSVVTQLGDLYQAELNLLDPVPDYSDIVRASEEEKEAKRQRDIIDALPELPEDIGSNPGENDYNPDAEPEVPSDENE